MTPKYFGSFAPPLTDELLDRYEELAASAEPQVRDAMNELLACCRKWWDLPESGADGTAHPSGRGVVVPLDKPIAEALDSVIPYADELDVMRKRFEAIDPNTQKELRDAANHLMWHVDELSLGREPISTDKL